MPPAPDPKALHRDDTIEGMRIERDGRSLRITLPWSKSAGGLILVWVLVWLGIVAFFTSLGGHRDGEFAALMALPALVMVYPAATRFFNSTLIEVTPVWITVRHAPLPWPGGRQFAARDVRAMRVAAKLVYARGGPFEECRLSLECANGKQPVLLKGLNMSALQMSSIAAAMSGFLGVPVHAA